jgi:deoxyribodipyrimidine photo-lyase
MKTLYWVTNDLRLEDNPVLARASKSESLTIVYCVNPRWFSPFRYHLASLGSHRWNFLQESISDMNSSLLKLGQQLLVLYQRPEIALLELINQHSIDRVCVSRQVGYDEIETLRYLTQKAPKLNIEEVDSHTLFDQDELPVPVAQWPDTFSGFRRKAQQLTSLEPIPSPTSLQATCNGLIGCRLLLRRLVNSGAVSRLLNSILMVILGQRCRLAIKK